MTSPPSRGTTKTVGRKHASSELAQMPCIQKKSEGDNDEIRNRDVTPLSSVYDKSKAILINLSCRHNLPPTKKRSSDFFTNKTSPPTKKDRKNAKPTTDIKTSRDAFDPGSEVLDKGEGKKKK
jgi:hypothetical protein